MFGIDLVYSLVYPRCQVLVFRIIFSARDGNLNQCHLPQHLGVLIEEQVKRVQLLWNSLNVIEAIHANDIFHVWVLFIERRDTFFDFVFLQTV